jgi:hypothetical protein
MRQALEVAITAAQAAGRAIRHLYGRWNWATKARPAC